MLTQRVAAWSSALVIGVNFNWLIALVLPVGWSIVGIFLEKGKPKVSRREVATFDGVITTARLPSTALPPKKFAFSGWTIG